MDNSCGDSFAKRKLIKLLKEYLKRRQQLHRKWSFITIWIFLQALNNFRKVFMKLAAVEDHDLTAYGLRPSRCCSGHLSKLWSNLTFICSLKISRLWFTMTLTPTRAMFHWPSSHHHQSLYMLWIFHYILLLLVIGFFFKVLINLSLEPCSIYLPLTITKVSTCLEFFTLSSLLLPLDSSSKVALPAIRNIIIYNICDKLIIQVWWTLK